MLNLIIKNENASYTVGRFSKATEISTGSNLRFNTQDNRISLNSTSYTSWEALYNDYIEKRLKDLYNTVNTSDKLKRVTSINNLTGDTYILAGRGIAVQQSGKSIKLCNTMYNTDVDQYFSKRMDMSTLAKAINYIMRYQLCIYHYLNVATHRSLTTTGPYSGMSCPYGSYLRYLSIRARWDHYIFMSWFNCNVIGGGDSISISLGLNNIFNELTNGTINVEILPGSTSNYMIWHGIFLEESSNLDTNVTANKPNSETQNNPKTVDYRIFRNGGIYYKLKESYFNDRWEGIERDEIEADYEIIKQENEDDTDVEDTEVPNDDRLTRIEAFTQRVYYPTPANLEGVDGYLDHNNPQYAGAYNSFSAPADITNPNDCVWSNYGGYWASGKIEIPAVSLQPGQSFKQIYSIARHPAVSGYTTRDIAINFTIKISFVFGEYTINKVYNDVLCYMQKPAPSSSLKDKSSDVVYILTATKDMAKYTDPLEEEEKS